MDSSLSQKSWVQAGFIFIGFLIIWKIVEQALAGGFNVMTGRDLESFGRFDWYILQPLMLILAPMIIGWLMVRYTESYMELVIVSILSTIALHLLEYAILDRLFDFRVSFPFLSWFVGILFEAGVFTLFLVFGAYFGKRQLQHQRRDHLSN